ATFHDTGGDLREVTKALVSAPEAWIFASRKLKRPSEWVISMVRAAGTTADPARFTAGQATLGEPLWRPPSPRGYADDEATWIDGVGQRLDIANIFAERIGGRVDPRQIIESTFQSEISADTK